MSEAEQILEEKLQHSDYIGVQNLILPWGVGEKSGNRDSGSLELLVDVYFDRYSSTSSIFTENSHENLVELLKTSVQEGNTLELELLAEKIAWDLDKIPGSVAFYLKIIWHNVENNQADWRIALWRVSKTVVSENPELVELAVNNPKPLANESIDMKMPITPKARSFPGNRQQAEEKALLNIPEKPVKAVLALGGNLGDVKQTFHRVITDLRNQSGIGISEISPLIRTKAVLMEGQEPQPDYLNAVLVIRSGLSARQLLHLTQEIELKYGRERKEKWGARSLDIDIITYGNLYSSIPELQLPHPRAHQRAFVLLPWSMVEESAVLPGRGEVVVLMNYAPDINGILDIDTDWFRETPIINSSDEETPLPTWNNLSDATQDIRIVDLYDNSEEPLDNLLSQFSETSIEIDETGNDLEEIDLLAELEDPNCQINVDNAVDLERIELDEIPAEYDEKLDIGKSVTYEVKPSFWGRLKRIFTGVSADIETESIAEDFFAVIEKDNAAKEEKLLKGRSFTDVIAEISNSNLPQTEKAGLPPDTGEIPIQKIIEATDKAQQNGLQRRSVLRPSSMGAIPVDEEKQFPVQGEKDGKN